MLEMFSRLFDTPPVTDLVPNETDASATWDSRTRPELADPFRPRWRLRVIPAGVAVSLLFWVMAISLVG